MIYTNDESDRSIRQRNFYLTVYVAPIVLTAAICGLIYWGSKNNYLKKSDTYYGYFMSFMPAIFLYGYNRRNWLKMPDESFHYVKGLQQAPKLSFQEPAEYEAEFFYSKGDKASTAFSGLVLIAVGAWLGFNRSKAIIVLVFTGILGLFLTYIGLKGLLDKTAKLKIAKNGLWTNKLGFVNWDDINFAEVIEDKSGKTPQLYLEIRLKGTKFEEANRPDERLLLSELKDKETVEMIVNSSITNYNNAKKESSS